MNIPHATIGLHKWEAAALLDNAAGRHSQCLGTASTVVAITSPFWHTFGLFLIPPSAGLTPILLYSFLGPLAIPFLMIFGRELVLDNGVRRMNRDEGIAAPYIAKLSHVRFQLLSNYGEEVPLRGEDVRLLWRVVDESARPHLLRALNLNQLATLHDHLGVAVFTPLLRHDIPAHVSWRALHQQLSPHLPPAALRAALTNRELQACLLQNPQLFSRIQRSLSHLQDPLLQQTLADLESEIHPVRRAPVTSCEPPNEKDKRIFLNNQDLLKELCSYLRSPEILKICSVCKSWQRGIYRGFQNSFKEAGHLWTWMNRAGQLSYLNKIEIPFSSLHRNIMGFQNGTVCIYAPDISGVFRVEREWGAHTAPIVCLQEIDTGIATGSLDRHIKLWDREGELQHTFLAASPVLSMVIDQEHVCCSTAFHLHIWERSTGDLVRSIPLGTRGEIPALLKQGSLLFGRKLGVIYRWDIATGNELPPLRGRELEFEELREVPLPDLPFDLRVKNCCPLFQISGHELIAKGKGNSIRIWDLSTGQEKRHILFPSSFLIGWNLTCLYAEKDFIFGGFADGKIRSWDRASGKEVELLRPDWRPLEERPQHRAPIVAIHFQGPNLVTQDATGVTIAMRFDHAQPRLRCPADYVGRAVSEVVLEPAVEGVFFTRKVAVATIDAFKVIAQQFSRKEFDWSSIVLEWRLSFWSQR